jgi:Ca2+-binding EF-hand superfamily protein
MTLSTKAFISLPISLLISLSGAFVLQAYADEEQALIVEDVPVIEDDTESAFEKTLEYNFSPDDRARLRKALADYAKSTDPEHVQIERKRKAMKESLKERFAQCNTDLDDSLDRQEVTDCLPQIARHFRAVDVDEDAVITLEELELAQAKWTERHKAAEARVEAQRIKEAEAEIKEKSKSKNNKREASSKGRRPS